MECPKCHSGYVGIRKLSYLRVGNREITRGVMICKANGCGTFVFRKSANAAVSMSLVDCAATADAARSADDGGGR